MRIPLSLGLAAGVLLFHAPAEAGGAPPAGKVESPWRPLPVGTVMEFHTTTETRTSHDKTGKRSEGSEVWTVVAKGDAEVTIEVARGGEAKRETRSLEPVDPIPEPPPPAPPPGEPPATQGGVSGAGPDGQEQVTAAWDQVETPFGTFDCVRVDRHRIRLESDLRSSEWLVAGFPEPLRWTQTGAGGAGVVTIQTDTRDMVRFSVPGESWADWPIGTSFDVEVVREHRSLYPPGQKPTVEKPVERWTLEARDASAASFAVEVVGGAKLPAAKLPLTLEPLRPGAVKSETKDRVNVTVERAKVETPLGKLDAWLVREHRAQLEMGGVRETWRARGYPLPVKSREEFGHKQQVDVETRTLIRLERPK
ncbi:MAG TPA: hypothetical protein VHF22_11735 [Planctomycetota bacterium]|nr:hypothetical protein [Planctomycetota bacterium]